MDLIDKQAAIDLYKRFQPYIAVKALEFGKALERLPSVQPEQKTGRWINGECDQCGEHAPFWEMASTYYLSNYCPNCGSYMRG